MPKTGWKYTKQGPDKSRSNMIHRSNASSKLHRKAPSNGSQKEQKHLRSRETIKRLKMYTSGKPIRNKEGKVVGGQFLMGNRAGDTEITSATGRIAPDRRWFGNTRVVGPKQLDTFRKEMMENVSNPYSVVLKRKKLPLGLLQDVAEYQHGAAAAKKRALLEQEPYSQVFGAKSLRKRVKLNQYIVSRTLNTNDNDNNDDDEKKKKSSSTSAETNLRNATRSPGGQAHVVDNPQEEEEENDQFSYSAMLKAAQESGQVYQKVNARDGIVPWGRDFDQETSSSLDWRPEQRQDLFTRGQSKRIWGELFKVLDCSDVVLHIIDARNVPGTRCKMLERHIKDCAKHKHLVFVLNKVDLVPTWVAKRWMGELAKDAPTIAFHASMTHAFGKGALISLLRQFGTLHQDKRQISVGIVGYPNVGKSSVINTLISKKSCKVAPTPGETKIWQYITLFSRISLIDCPGIVVNTAGDSETDLVLKSVVRAERLDHPQDFVEAIVERVQRQHILAQYKLPRDFIWKDATELMERISLQCGRLLKGGEPCLRSAAIMLIHDFQRGRLPHYVAPPELKEDVVKEKTGDEESKEKTKQDNEEEEKEANEGIQVEEQDLSQINREQENDEGNKSEADNEEEENVADNKDAEETNNDETEDDGPKICKTADWDDD